ncbi:MAG TPA: glycoside hydrolase family 27 protein [Candidatus Methylomirabilis sp.]|nr:glycoside hydrolase family 27 protein [Candidatus Methylomirabilis sp.]
MNRRRFTRISVFLLSLVCAISSLRIFATDLAGKSSSVEAQDVLAATPPMGWNSWDSYGESINESDIKANAAWMAEHLKAYGWEYVVVDSGWYVTNHSAGTNAAVAQFSLDANGRYTPAVSTIPSAENRAGFKPLADYVHSLGLKFGIHILRGIPKEAVRKNLPIAGSRFRAKAAADTADTCPWNPFNYGLNVHSPAAQAYYDSLARLYAGWGVDFLKVDCISSHPYKGDEIRMISLALHKVHRPIVLSLSPGPAPLEKAAELRRYAQMWRISDDVWDLWHSDKDFPQGVENQFARAAKWTSFSGPGHWPDADMLPIGRLEPAAGWEQPRGSRLTHDEQRTLLTLWSIFRSPLIMGGNLTLCDEWTQSALTNAELIGVDQHSTGSHAVLSNDRAAVWMSTPESEDGSYVAIFNLAAAPQSFHYSWKDLGLKRTAYSLRDLWEHEDLGSRQFVDVTVPPHGAVLYWASDH